MGGEVPSTVANMPDIAPNITDIGANLPDIAPNIIDIGDNMPDIAPNIIDIGASMPTMRPAYPDIRPNISASSVKLVDIFPGITLVRAPPPVIQGRVQIGHRFCLPKPSVMCIIVSRASGQTREEIMAVYRIIADSCHAVEPKVVK